MSGNFKGGAFWATLILLSEVGRRALKGTLQICAAKKYAHVVWGGGAIDGVCTYTDTGTGSEDAHRRIIHWLVVDIC